ncbi:MAG: ABC transporter permease [Pseudonocardia sp.]|uniref:ABC transporter permease n=1 Tax=unclassified Pseudonocardia TaxID=2619320 RepID=UPI0008699DA5|nr:MULTISPECIES: ABC transporter permease [unclassified Pseudonocardia]MBN9107794.1 ABC transporter permease [Pseudonocardia sp.]ODU25738.1 MAG: ABC transporter permease [Pseudonocardia sp. SCN 72-51]ODV07502.1 MAG: ABC transporter permease [Pseudonocardia sp. SCN 73-27]
MIGVGWPLVVALLVLVAIAVAVSLAGRVGTSRMTAVAAVRAAVQLGAVSLVILAVVRSWWSTVAFTLLMAAVATWTSARRMTPHRSGLAAGIAILAGAVPVLAVVLASGTVPPTGIAVVPITGIVVGGAMSATSLAGRRALEGLTTRRGEYEAALSLGFGERDAAMLVVGPSGAEALVPALDQTRTVGLVTLPGAFVGVLLGGGDPVTAGAAQVLVLVGLLAAETIAVVVTVELVARGVVRRTLPETRGA